MAELLDRVPRGVAMVASAWARIQAKTWPTTTYTHADLVLFFEKGYLQGWLAAQPADISNAKQSENKDG